MSGRGGYRIGRTVAAAPDVVFGLFADAPGWSSWAKPLIGTSRWARRGTDDPGGVGAIRVTGRWPLLIREEITDYQPPSRLSYRYVGRLIPVRDYHATVEFTENARGGTDLSWSASFVNLVPGPGVRWIILSTVRFVAWRLAREAVRHARSAR
ncbi:MAG TPA: SRPBCC family protein [Pseudonocardiaceae bacterium]|jgi:hypothetical protein|nr:SRPBCC family protein [Pseudonocardiaceae bacterium]